MLIRADAFSRVMKAGGTTWRRYVATSFWRCLAGGR
jgi:hypothetical protein